MTGYRSNGLIACEGIARLCGQPPPLRYGFCGIPAAAYGASEPERPGTAEVVYNDDTMVEILERMGRRA